MLVTSDTTIYDPKLDPEKVNTLNQHLAAINQRMTPLKKKWAESIMHYNRVSKKAFEWRFVQHEVKDGRQSPDGGEAIVTTNEKEYGEYEVAPLIQKKVDEQLKEFITREYFCDVQSIANDQYRTLVQTLVNEVFNTPRFMEAAGAAFFDALTKKAGALRLRLYDVKKNVKAISFSRTSAGELRKNLTDEERHVQKGLTVEYVDIEDIYIDPEAREPQEMFISTPVTDLELVAKFPQMLGLVDFSKYQTNSLIVVEEAKKRGRKPNQPETIKSQWLNNYKIGEKFAEWYKYPELITGFIADAKQNTSSEEEFNLSDNYNPFLVEGMPTFNDAWDNMFFGSDYNTFGAFEFQQARKYRINEYYNWADPNFPRYILYIDDYVLYDGPMIEPFFGCPVVPVYYEKTKDYGFFGQSVNDKINAEQKKASDRATKASRLADMAGVSFIEINDDRLEDSNQTIEAKPLTIIRTRGTDSSGVPYQIPAVNQIAVQYPGLEISTQLEAKYNTIAESIIPSGQEVSAAMPKQEREEMIRARLIGPNTYLKKNADQFTKLAYRAFAAKCREIEYLTNGERPIKLATDNIRALIIRKSEKEIAKAKVEIAQILDDLYKQTITQTVEALRENEQTASQFEQMKQQKLAQYVEALQQSPEVRAELEKMDEATRQRKMQELAEKANAQAVADVDKAILEMAQSQVQKVEDQNLYISLEDIDDLLSAEKEFQFGFRKSKQEALADTNGLLSVLNQLPLSGLALDYNRFMEEILIAHNFNPQVRLKEVGAPSSLQGIANSKITWFGDFDKMPVVGENVLEKAYGISKDELKSDENSPLYQNIVMREKAKVLMEIELNKQKAAAQGQTKMANEAFRRSAEVSANQALNPEAAQQAVMQSGQPMEDETNS